MREKVEKLEAEARKLRFQNQELQKALNEHQNFIGRIQTMVEKTLEARNTIPNQQDKSVSGDATPHVGGVDTAKDKKRNTRLSTVCEGIVRGLRSKGGRRKSK